MVKVLENKIVDLDLLPGQAFIDAQKQFKEQMKTAKGAFGGEIELPEGSQVVEGQEAAKIANQQGIQIPKDMLPENMSEEQKSQAKGFGGVIIDGSGKVISGLAGTVGGVLKGVGDTAGNTVYGLGQTGTGLVTGLANTAKAPFTSSPAAAPQAAEPPQHTEKAAQQAEEAQRRKPRKIELRNAAAEGVAEPEKAGGVVEA